MSGPAPAVFLADFVRAVRTLRPDDDDTLLRIARLLDVHHELPAASLAGEDEEEETDSVEVSDGPTSVPSGGTTPESGAARVVPSTLVQLPPQPNDRREPLVFISRAARDESDKQVQSIVQALEENDFHVWIESTHLRPGDEWEPAIEKALETCDAAVIVLSPAALTSSWSQHEITFLLERARQDRSFILLPVCLPGVTIEQVWGSPIASTGLMEWQMLAANDPDQIAPQVVEALRGLSRTWDTPALEWTLSAEPLPRGASEEHAPRPPLEPLLVPEWTRAILSTALSTACGEGDVDVERVAERIARREAVTAVPRLPLTTLRRGVQVLVDQGQGMQPFMRDLTAIQGEIRRVAGEHRARVLRFAGTPLRAAGAGPRGRWGEYLPPPRGTPVLLLTDLGIGRPQLSADPATVEEWLELAAVVRRAGCPLVALVPYGAHRWPAALRDAMTLVEWDRPTSAARVRARVGRAHPVDA